jgi:thiamine monophosphate synthase
LGERALIGVSCHDAAGLAAAASGGATFATLSPVFPSPNKGKPLGLPSFSALVRAANLPIYALGGVAVQEARALKAAGASGLAVISAVFSSQDPAAAVAGLLAAWQAT